MMTGWLHEDLKQHRAMLSRLEAEWRTLDQSRKTEPASKIPAIEAAMAQNGTAQAHELQQIAELEIKLGLRPGKML